MLRVRKGDVHSGNERQEGSRPRQLFGKLQTDTGRNDSQGGDGANTKRRQRTERGSSVSDKTKRTQAKPLADGHFGRVPNAKTAQDIAKWYWEEYKLVVVPANIGQKHPLGEWANIDTVDKAYERWLTAKFINEVNQVEEAPHNTDRFNYACLTGPSNVTVVDFDKKPDAKHYMDTFTVETPRGVHFYIRLPEQVPNSVNKEAGVDIRSKGGISILPPSLGKNGTLYRLTNDSPIAEVSMVDYNTYCSTLGIERNTEGPRNEPGWFVDVFADGALRGERNDTIAKLAGYLINKGLDLADTISILLNWNDTGCVPPLSADEVVQTVGSIARKHERDGVKITSDFDEELAEARSDPTNPFAS